MDAAILLREITRCLNVQTYLAGVAPDHPCKNIVDSQQSAELADFQVPEPWSGDIEAAPILFLSSNPSVDPLEDYPRWMWEDQVMADFFTHRFGGGSKPWVKDALYPLLQNGTHKEERVRFWAAVRARATELLETDARPGIDYAMSEVVHCKSAHEVGVSSAADECARLWLSRLASVAGARVVVVLGGVAEKSVREVFGVVSTGPLSGPIAIGGHESHFVFLPHPNARIRRTCAACLTPEQLRSVQQQLK